MSSPSSSAWRLAQGHADAAMYLVYFDQLFTALEVPVADLREMIEDESRQLLGGGR